MKAHFPLFDNDQFAARMLGRWVLKSLSVANGRIHVTNEKGQTVVVQAAKEYKILAENDLEEYTIASPALCGPALFMRTERALYRIEEAGE